MRRLKSDVSHRVRPRGPSIFGAGWFRVLLGGGVAVILGLALGPSIAAWFGADLPHSVRRLALWGGGPATQTPTQAPERQEQSAAPADPSVEPRVPPASAPSVAPAPPPATEAPPVVSKAEPDPSRLTSPPAVFRVQVGAFLEHQNADRLVERLRKEGLGAATSVFDQSRLLYRVFVVPPDGAPPERADKVLDQLQRLGFTPEATEEGTAVTQQPVPLATAVEASQRLREHGIRVRLKQEVGSATYRVVRVGAYTTMDEANRALATLVARGFEGFVVHER